MAAMFGYGEVGDRIAMGNLVNCWSAFRGKTDAESPTHWRQGLWVVGGYGEWELTLS